MSPLRPRRWRSRRSGTVGGRTAGASAWQLEQRNEELEQHAQDLERILRGLGEGVLAVDRAGIVVHANRAAIELLQLDAGACLGSHMFVAVPHPELCTMLEDVMRGTAARTSEVVLEHPGGEQVLLVVVRPLRAPAGAIEAEPEGAVGVVRDITELRRLERARRDFFGNVSHELKTPIAAIRGAVETIIDDPDMSPEVRMRFLDGARRHTQRLEALVADLLSLARFADGPRALEPAEVDLAVLAREVLGASEGAASARGITLHVEVEAGVDPRLEADEEALRQALSNLVDNAIAHSVDEGAVRVRIDARDGLLLLRVIDTGEGIPPDAVDRIFERFFRVDTARSRARGGTGIGLSIVKHVAQAHGGAVSVESELGVGSTFLLQLPVSRTAQRGS